MRRLLTLVCLLCLAIPAGISISGCSRNPGEKYCNGLGYGLKVTDVSSIDLEPRTTGISLAFGQTQQVSSPSAKTCKGDSATVAVYTYGTTNNQLVDISPTGNICAGTWNRNTGGGIANYTICSKPNPLPANNYASAYVSASGDSVTSNPVQVFVHPQVTSVSLLLSGQSSTSQQCYSQNETASLDVQANYSNNGTETALCGGSKPSCSSVIGNLSYSVGTPSVATINNETNQITAALPGTTAITASISGSGSSAGYFSTCPPKSISVTLNGQAGTATPVTVTQGVTQNLVTSVIDTKNNPITGLSLDYQSTDPIDISASSAGAITSAFPGTASIYAVCQPSTCNPSPINQIGLYGTGLSISSKPVAVTTPGTASDYVWFAAPGQSQYVVPIELLTGTVGSNVRLPYVPNSAVMDQLGSSLYFGSTRELMIYSTFSNSVTKQDTSVPGVVLAVSPNGSEALINDQTRQVFYLYNTSSGASSTFGGLGTAAAWTPDSKTLYVVDSAAQNSLPENVAAGITGHTDTLYVYNVNTGWTTHDLSTTSGGSQSLALTIPGVGAYLSGSTTVAHTWCPVGTVGNLTLYPWVDTVPVQTDVLAATIDGQHILGAAVTNNGVTLSDIGVTIPTTECTLAAPLSTNGTLLTPQPLVNVNATAIKQVVPAPASNLAFITYAGSTTGATLPYYVPGTSGAAGTVGYVSLTGGSAITAPVAGAFTPDNKTFFVSTAGDNMIHYISIPSAITSTTQPTDSQQISPNLPACTFGVDPGCKNTSVPSGNPVPATVITVKPRATT
jgi:hypothetical protein